MTVLQAKELIRKRMKDGTVCPCCNQYVKIYKRRLNAPMARILLLIYREYVRTGKRYFIHVDEHLKQFKVNCRYYSLLRFWGLIRPQKNLRPDGSKRNGYWRITEDAALWKKENLVNEGIQHVNKMAEEAEKCTKVAKRSHKKKVADQGDLASGTAHAVAAMVKPKRSHKKKV